MIRDPDHRNRGEVHLVLPLPWMARGQAAPGKTRVKIKGARHDPYRRFFRDRIVHSVWRVDRRFGEVSPGDRSESLGAAEHQRRLAVITCAKYCRACARMAKH